MSVLGLSTTEHPEIQTTGPNVTGVEGTAEWLAVFLGTSEYTSLMHKECIDGECLNSIAKSKDDLCAFGITKLGHVWKIYNYFARLEKKFSSPVVCRLESVRKTRELSTSDCKQEKELPLPMAGHGSGEQAVSMPSGEQVTQKSLWPSYEDIFKHRSKGKKLLKLHFPCVHHDLIQGHHVIRSWFKDHETDEFLHEILHADFKAQPDMRAKLNEFVQLKAKDLPPLVFKEEGDEGNSYSMRWKHETVYEYIIAHRQEFKKNLKRKQIRATTSDTSKTDVSKPTVTKVDPLRQLMLKEPDLMAAVLKGGKIGFYGIKDRPTVVHLKARQSDTVLSEKQETVRLIGMGQPEGIGQEYPYTTFLLRVTELDKSCNKSPTCDYFVPHCVTVKDNPLRVSDIQLDTVIEVARSYSRLLMPSGDLDLLTAQTWLSRTALPGRNLSKPSESIGLEQTRSGDTSSTIKVEVNLPLDEVGQSTEESDSEEENQRMQGDAENVEADLTYLTYRPKRRKPLLELNDINENNNEANSNSVKLRSLQSLKTEDEQVQVELKKTICLDDIQNIYERLSEDSVKTIALVILGVKTCDQLSTAIGPFISKKNKLISGKKPFVGHGRHSMEQKIHMLVRWALLNENVKVTGNAKVSNDKVHLERKHVFLQKS